MNRLILTGVFGAAAIGLAACDYDKEDYNNQAGYNAEETNYSTENAADYGNTANDSNMTDGNAMTNDTDGNATDNAAVANGY